MQFHEIFCCIQDYELPYYEHPPVPVYIMPSPHKAVYYFDDQLQFRPWTVLNKSDPEIEIIGQDDFGMDEIKVYEWEGYGRPYSNAGSLSSLKSFGHVDDLELPEKLIELTSRTLKMSDRFQIPPKYFKSSWL